MFNLLLAFLVSTIVTLLVVRSAHRHARFSADHDVSGPQKFHSRSVPRIGGFGIFLSLLAVQGGMLWRAPALAGMGGMLLLCSLPAFGSGLIEDLTKKVTPRVRLLCAAFAGGLGVFTLDATISHTTIPGLDWIVAFPLGAAVVTVFVVAGISNAINIIDGFNGLSSMCVTMMLISVAYVAFQVDDVFVFSWALAGIGAVLGFFIWNFPSGLIFLGDGGAYFLGFFLSELAILLIHRNPQVSPMFPLLICIYPVFETVFSIYRRRFLQEVSPGLPDGIHLHSLIYRRLMRWAVGTREAREITRRNSMTSPYLWMLCMLSVIPAVLFWNSTTAMVIFILLFGVTYVTLYWKIVRFKSPRWLVVRR